MKSFELKTSSWHYKIAHWSSTFGIPSETNICEYFWMVARGIVFFIMACVAAGTISGIFAFTIVNYIGYFFFNLTLYPVSIFGGTVILGVAGAIGILFLYAWIRVKVKELDDEPEQEPGFVRLAYDKVKNKTCFKITFKD